MKDHVGFGALNEAFVELGKGGYQRVFVVASGSGWKRFNEPEKRAFFAERETFVFSDFNPNPEITEIMAGVDAFNAFKPDLILAYGGGSPMDVAKMIKAVAYTKEPFNPAEPEKIVVSGDGPPLVAVTTTAGSGSEATLFAVFYRGVEKQSVASPKILPDMAVVDPEMTYSLPPDQTAATGFDGLSQAVEAYWCSNTTEDARELAGAAIAYALPHIHGAVHSPNAGNRYNMIMAAYLSGKAISITRTTMPHALAYHLTKVYGLPHGHAVALTLPHFFLINMDASLPVNSPLGAEGQRKNMEGLFRLLGQETAEGAFSAWRELMRGCGLKASLKEVGVDSEAKVRALVESMNMARQSNQPVAADKDYLVRAFMERL